MVNGFLVLTNKTFFFAVTIMLEIEIMPPKMKVRESWSALFQQSFNFKAGGMAMILEGFYHVYAKSLMKHNDLDKKPREGKQPWDLLCSCRINLKHEARRVHGCFQVKEMPLELNIQCLCHVHGILFELTWIKRYKVLADKVNILILLRKKETFERALMIVEDDFLEMAESSYHHSLGFGILIVACWPTTDWVAVLVC